MKEREAKATSASIREAEIAAANPLMNLQAALEQGSSSSSGGSFAVKKRWDDGKYLCCRGWPSVKHTTADLIFKNQATGQSDKPSGQFVNDLLRTEFHKFVILSASYMVFFLMLDVSGSLCRNLSSSRTYFILVQCISKRTIVWRPIPQQSEIFQSKTPWGSFQLL